MRIANFSGVRAFVAVSMVLFGATSGFATNVGSPESVKIKFYEFWVSPNTDCTGLTRVFNDASPSYQDVVGSISFGQMTIPNGTYQCVAFKISDVVKLTPNYNSDFGHCVQGTEITRDLFRTGDTSQSPDGTVITGSGTNPTGQIENGMYIYLSTNGDTVNNSGNVPSSPAKLDNAYVVSGDNNAIAVFDFTNGIEDTGAGSGGSCSPEEVTFRFRYQ